MDVMHACIIHPRLAIIRILDAASRRELPTVDHQASNLSVRLQSPYPSSRRRSSRAGTPLSPAATALAMLPGALPDAFACRHTGVQR
jgi:hypothetical protein